MPNITEFLTLLSAEKVGTPSGWVNMASPTQSSCHNYKIVGTSACMTDIGPVTLYVEIPAFDSVKYKEVKKGRETGKGQEVFSWKSIEPVLGFTIVGDETTHNLLQRLKFHETITFTRLHGDGAPEAADVMSLEVTSAPEDLWLRLEVVMTFKDSLIINKLCCGSFYDGAPFLECDGEGETGDPNNDPTCVGLIVTITLGAGPVLTATPSGGSPAGVETWTWYLDGDPFGSGMSVVPTLPGVYRVDYQIGNCFATSEFTYNEPCTGFEVTITQLILGDGSILLIATPNLVGTVQWQESLSSVWTDIVGETSLVFQPDHSGLYRAVAVTGAECTDDSNELTVEVGTICDGLYLVELVNNGGTLEATIVDYEGEGTPSYQWYLDTGSGLVDLGLTGTSIPVGDPGLYIVIVTIDGCVQTAQIFINCEAVANPCGDPCGFPFQDFGPGVTGYEFSVTQFILLDPDLYTEDQIKASIRAEKNGVGLRYVTPAALAALPGSDPTARTLWSINYAMQRVILHTDWPLKATELLTTFRIR